MQVPVRYQRRPCTGNRRNFQRNTLCRVVVLNWCFKDHSSNFSRSPPWRMVSFSITDNIAQHCYSPYGALQVEFFRFGRRRTDSRSVFVMVPGADGPVYWANQCDCADCFDALSHFVRDYELCMLRAVSERGTKFQTDFPIFFVAHRSPRVSWVYVCDVGPAVFLIVTTASTLMPTDVSSGFTSTHRTLG